MLKKAVVRSDHPSF